MANIRSSNTAATRKKGQNKSKSKKPTVRKNTKGKGRGY